MLVRQGGEEDLDDIKMGELAFLPERTCAICYQDQNPSSTSESEILAIAGQSGGVVGSAQTDITNPYETIPCGCIYCFVCIATRLDAEEGEGWICLKCGETVRECKPWLGDVLEETSRPSTGKSVTFSDDTTHLMSGAISYEETSMTTLESEDDDRKLYDHHMEKT
jgi:peroxin-2